MRQLSVLPESLQALLTTGGILGMLLRRRFSCGEELTSNHVIFAVGADSLQLLQCSNRRVNLATAEMKITEVLRLSVGSSASVHQLAPVLTKDMT